MLIDNALGQPRTGGDGQEINVVFKPADTT